MATYRLEVKQPAHVRDNNSYCQKFVTGHHPRDRNAFFSDDDSEMERQSLIS